MRFTDQHIESIPGKCGGKPVIAGTRIRVWDVYCHYERSGLSADEILGIYPELSLAEVYAALSYYYGNKPSIDRQMKEANEFVDQLMRTQLSEIPDTRDSVSS